MIRKFANNRQERLNVLKKGEKDCIPAVFVFGADSRISLRLKECFRGPVFIT
jgi:hypothetical protein